MPEGLLDGMRVLDLSVWRPGPYATQLLAELGADVLKVEPPGGDPMRAYAELFASLHAGKRSICLDLKRPDDLGVALELGTSADVVVEGFRPGVADRLGVGDSVVRSHNPGVVYCSISGFGQTGPLAAVPGHDLSYQAWSGALAPDGGPPMASHLAVADLAAGMTAAMAVCAAWARRARTGRGERIDVSMADLLATWTGAAASRLAGVDGPAGGPAGYGTFATADGGYVALSVLAEDRFWASLCGEVGLDDAADLDVVERTRRAPELQARLAEAIVLRGRDELVAALLAVDVPVAPVLDRAGMLALDHFRERGTVTAAPGGDSRVGQPVRFEQHPPRRPTPSPALGEHQGQGWLPR